MVKRGNLETIASKSLFFLPFQLPKSSIKFRLINPWLFSLKINNKNGPIKIR